MQIVMEQGKGDTNGQQFEFDLMTLPYDLCFKILKYVQNQAKIITK